MKKLLSMIGNGLLMASCIKENVDNPIGGGSAAPVIEITECLTPCEVQTNLMGDAAERLGKKIAQFIKKQIE